MDKVRELAKWIQESHYLVFFGGAGTSTDSGIKDFRGKNGLYKEKFHGYSPEEILSKDFFKEHIELFKEYVKKKLSAKDAKPNPGHYALMELEKRGLLKKIITQNIDGLHQDAGSKEVIELHGTLRDWYCLSCHTHKSHTFPCGCGGVVRPRVTLYGEMLEEEVANAAIAEIEKADLLIIAGTSLTVYPAAYYLRFFQGKRLVIINQEPTDYDNKANLVIQGNFADTMTEVLKALDELSE